MAEGAAAWLERLTLEQKIAQMIVVRGHDYLQKTLEMNAEDRVGAVGAVLLTTKGSRRLEDIVAWVNRFRAESGAPVLFYLDAENGLADTFDFGTSFPALMALGATRSPELAYRMGAAIAKEARAVGFGIVSNPTVDVNSNPDNPIINTRAISDRVDLIVELAAELIRGMQETGVIPTAKHFPGHGDTQEDSHVSMPVVARDKEYLMDMDLRPYKELIPQGLMGIMTAHILFPALLGPGEDPVPATLSKAIMTRLVREELGFEGLLVSDSLTMRGIKAQYGIERSAVMAVLAGHDIILQDYESDPEITFRALLDAVRRGDISMARIDLSVARILEAKERMGLLGSDPVDVIEAGRIVGSAAHEAVAREIAERSVTALEAQTLPLTGKRTLLIATRGAEEGMEAEDLGYVIKGKASYLFERAGAYADDIRTLVVSEYPTSEDAALVIRELSDDSYEEVVFATFVRVLSYKEGSGTVPESQLRLLEAIRERREDATLLLFGSPYAAKSIVPFANCLCTYGDCVHSIDAALKVLYGEIQASGKLPVDVNGKYRFGYGL
ncbi:glycoside hydrolase family 3 protein [Cohnella sp. JJ-181]|uniref:glycoside hydrolase family 3 protein n=1 Tax=Cohnella rhizoplanae TaxID=2974897 RepID=UPI0022FFA9E5|nr:glycoside hydrolase family 3 protein [Cohnella sp. JJ-181]CAI6018430.1 Beta-hexosaminidase [Cohnella sp. JJ-181]